MAGGPLLNRILAARGITDPAAIHAHTHPRLTDLHDPRLLPGIDTAANRLLAALAARERVVVYGDYDVDGITGTTILIRTLHHLAPAAPLGTHIPHRQEGYGLSSIALERLAAEGARVVVSVDCGVAAVEPAAAARRAGLDLIITDHHNPPPEGSPWPDCLAIVHPRALGSTYPFTHLSGAGVAYKLAWRLCSLAAHATGRERVDTATAALLVDLLPLCALGTIADMVPLTGENRIIARFGLERMKHSPLTGLAALVHAAGLDGEKVSTWDVGFKLGPRLNAGGRMAHADGPLELFTTADPERARQIAETLEAHNAQRRAVEQRIADEAASRAIESGQTAPGHRGIVLAHPEWHQGVIGIVASRLVERFGRPAILLTEHGGLLHGSGRSIPGFNLHAALADCSEHLISFGGHDVAAGLKLRPENLGAFTHAFVAVCNQALTDEDLIPRLEIDAPATPDDLTPDAVRELDIIEPCGQGNPAVRLLLRGVRLIRPPTPMGKGGEHMALEVAAPGPPATARTLRLVCWRMGAHRPLLRAGQTIDAVIRPAISTYTGRPVVEPEAVDIRIP